MAALTGLPLSCGIRARDCGLFFGRGVVPHVSRTMDCDELIFVRAGTLGMFEGPQRFTISAGETLILRQGRRHGGMAVMPKDLEFYWIHFTVAAVAKALVQVPQHGLPLRPSILEALWRRLLDDQARAPLDPLAGGLVIALMLTEVQRVEAAGAVSGGCGLASAAKAWLTAHWHEPVSTLEVARAVGCHPHHLARVYRETFQRTVLADIQSSRLNHARHLLITSRLTISEIARASGLGTSAWLRRVYRRQFGESPRGTRLAHARMHVNTM
jgi:AraC-like DNA-binding protein